MVTIRDKLSGFLYDLRFFDLFILQIFVMENASLNPFTIALISYKTRSGKHLYQRLLFEFIHANLIGVVFSFASRDH